MVAIDQSRLRQHYIRKSVLVLIYIIIWRNDVSALRTLNNVETNEETIHKRAIKEDAVLCSKFTLEYEPVYYCWLVDPCVEDVIEAPHFLASKPCNTGDTDCEPLPAEYEHCRDWQKPDGTQSCSDYGPLIDCCKYITCSEGKICLDLVPSAAYCTTPKPPSPSPSPSPSPVVLLSPVVSSFPVEHTPLVEPMSPVTSPLTQSSPVLVETMPPIRVMPPHAPPPPPPPAPPPPTQPPPSPVVVAEPSPLPSVVAPVMESPSNKTIPDSYFSPLVNVSSPVEDQQDEGSSPLPLTTSTMPLPTLSVRPEPASSDPPISPASTSNPPESSTVQPDGGSRIKQPSVSSLSPDISASQNSPTMQPTWTTAVIIVVVAGVVLVIVVWIKDRERNEHRHEERLRSSDDVVAIDQDYWKYLNQSNYNATPESLIGGTVRFSSPYVALKMRSEEYSKLPIMIFLPGFDGSGMTAVHQFPFLVDSFDFITCTIPLSDRTPFAELVGEVKEFIQQYVMQQGHDRPVYLLAESFGALLGVMTAAQCPNLVDRLVLINPATSYEQSIWPIVGPLISQLPNELFLGVSFAVAPFLGNPLTLMARTIDFTQPLDQQMSNIIKSIFAAFGTIGFIGDVFTPESLAWKIDLVRQGVELANPLLSKIKQRTLVITCDGDWMLPSARERTRLINIMPRCSGRSMGLRSHALLLEAGVNIAQIIKEEGFYVTERKFTVPGTQHAINRFGSAKPVELPTEIERKRASEQFVYIDRLVSPVFYSTNKNNEIVYGLSGVPDTGPVLFVGNHQLVGQDTFTLVNAIMREKKFLIRGLAHPLVASLEDDDRVENLMFLPFDRSLLQNFMTTYGAVAVSPMNLYRLLKQGERVLLYPGGAREAFKLKTDQKYELFWPETAEFVRMAAKFQATIITIAAIGLEDWLDIALDRDDILKVPVLKDIAQNQIDTSPEARPGVSNENGDVFLTVSV
eukprot:g1794.t1